MKGLLRDGHNTIPALPLEQRRHEISEGLGHRQSWRRQGVGYSAQHCSPVTVLKSPPPSMRRTMLQTSTALSNPKPEMEKRDSV